jgi:hypothetical protein
VDTLSYPPILSDLRASFSSEGVAVSAWSGSSLVLTSRQLLVSQVAVAMCSAVMELGLGDWEDYRIALGGEQDDLARRLRAAQQLDENAAVEVVDCLDACGRPVVAVAVELSDDDIWVLQVALERLRGILARTGEFEGALDGDVDEIVMALLDTPMAA